MKLISRVRNLSGSRQPVARFIKDKQGVAAVEFAFIVPLMLTLLFGMIDVASGVAVDRKVTLTARTLSDLVSQGTKVTPTDISNFFKMGSAIMTPYTVTPATMTQKISAISIDASKKATVVWSYSGVVSGSSVTVTAGYAASTVITTIPANLLIANTQLIWSEVSYTFTPITGYLIKTNMTMSEDTYTRPRQSDTVVYSTS